MNREQLVRCYDVSSTVRCLQNGVPYGSLLGKILFFIFMNYLADVFAFTVLFAPDLKMLPIYRTFCEIQKDQDHFENWVKKEASHGQACETDIQRG